MTIKLRRNEIKGNVSEFETAAEMSRQVKRYYLLMKENMGEEPLETLVEQIDAFTGMFEAHIAELKEVL